ncbi:hypothetical protein VB002_07240 [Campylobacter concisus]
MNLFLQNQAEFKNSLVNMGFTELEMNFSDQNQRQEKENKQRTNIAQIKATRAKTAKRNKACLS